MGSSTDIITQPSAPRVTTTSLHPLSNSMRPTFPASSRLPTGMPVKISAWKITHANENHNVTAFIFGQQLHLKTAFKKCVLWDDHETTSYADIQLCHAPGLKSACTSGTAE